MAHDLQGSPHETADTDLLNALVETKHPLIAMIRTNFDQADRARRPKSDQWLCNLRAVRGTDSQAPMRPQSEVSKIYVRTTNTKTRAAYAQLNEAILSSDKFPIAVRPTPIPDGIAEYAHMKDPEAPQGPQSQADSLNVGFEGDGIDLPPGATQAQMSSILGSAYSEGLEESMFEEGNDAMGTGIQLTPAKAAARKMEKMIQDQLDESKARAGLRRALYECVMLGAGAMKGPFTENVMTNDWVQGKNIQSVKQIPKISFVSLWDLYVDPNAYNTSDIEWVIERHRLNAAQLKDLAKQPLFDPDVIERLARTGGNYTQQYHEYELHENNETENEQYLFEVLEYWGYVSTHDAVTKLGLNVPEGSGDTIQVNAWISGDEVLRVNINPFVPSRIPYFIFPYEEDPYSIYGTGIPELMEDLQYLMNGMTRLAVENAMLAGNVILDVDKQALAAEADMTLYPGKIFERQAGATGNAVNAINIPFVAHQNMQMFTQFRQMTDESTGIQSISHGQTGVTGTGRTASGLSLLLDSASIAIKNVIRNIDDNLLKPLATAYFQWNMQYNSQEHAEIKGDLEIKAMGSHNLITKERRAQSLQTFLQLSTNPAIAPLIRLPKVIKELAIQLDMEPEEILNSPEESIIYAQIMALQNPQGGQANQLPADAAPAPGSEGFTGNTEGAGNQQGINGQEGVQ